MDSHQNHKTILVICGPTASGKTSLAIQTAKQLGTEIISADSRQFYREMNIGTAKPTPQELAEVKHHFINSLSIEQNYSAGDFETDALALLNQLFQLHDTLVLVGGSGLYIKALCEGFDDLPEVDEALREQLKEEVKQNHLDRLVLRLQELDPEYAAQIDLHNPQRVVRALEVIESSGQKFSDLRKQKQEKRPFACKYFGIDWERETLYERINHRVDEMIADGLEEEARRLFPKRSLNALQTVGYTEWFAHFDGKIDREEAIRLIKRNTRRFAKRQMTWFRNQEEMTWLPPGETVVDK